MKKLPILAFSTFILVSCSAPPQTCVPYDLSTTTDLIKLPGRLKEISGITFWNTNKLACVQDEKGIIYFYDIKKDKLKDELDFGKDKDYEGITNVNDTLFVLCSNGDLFEVNNAGTDTQTTTTFHTFLNKKNNCEGLCYDAAHNRLLIACKGRPAKKTASKFTKAVYAFPLDTKELERTPVYDIDPDDVKNFLDEELARQPAMVRWFTGWRTEKKAFDFEPSELAIHPLTGDIYMLSSVGKTLAILNPDGTLKCAVRLDPHIFKQPEGITFSAEGDMLISDEGKEGKANIVRYHYQH